MPTEDDGGGRTEPADYKEESDVSPESSDTGFHIKDGVSDFGEQFIPQSIVVGVVDDCGPFWPAVLGMRPFERSLYLPL